MMAAAASASAAFSTNAVAKPIQPSAPSFFWNAGTMSLPAQVWLSPRSCEALPLSKTPWQSA